MNFVLDASVALAWCFEDEGSELAGAVLDRLLSSEAVVPHHWTLETANGLLSAERRGRLSGEDVAHFSRMLLDLPIAVDPVTRSAAFNATRRLARAQRLTLYDAAYLELAIRLGLPLATLDTRLGAAARAEGVQLLGASGGGEVT